MRAGRPLSLTSGVTSAVGQAVTVGKYLLGNSAARSVAVWEEQTAGPCPEGPPILLLLRRVPDSTTPDRGVDGYDVPGGAYRLDGDVLRRICRNVVSDEAPVTTVTNAFHG